MPQLLQVYEVKPEEVETIFLDLYGRFDNGIMLGEDQYAQKRKNTLNEIIRKWYYLGQEDREKILQENNVTSDETEMIIDLSGRIVKHKNMLKIVENDKKIGED